MTKPHSDITHQEHLCKNTHQRVEKMQNEHEVQLHESKPKIFQNTDWKQKHNLILAQLEIHNVKLTYRRVDGLLS